jgi:hypothetical protein
MKMSEWKRVTPNEPCRHCGRGDERCARSADGRIDVCFLRDDGTAESRKEAKDGTPYYVYCNQVGRSTPPPRRGGRRRQGAARPVEVDVDAPDREDAEGEQGQREPQAKTLLRLAAGFELFHAPDGRAYASVPMAGHTECHPVRGTALKSWLIRAFHVATGAPPSSEAVTAAIGVLEATARFDGPTLPVFIRVAPAADSTAEAPAYVLDLADASWRAARVAASGWELIEQPGVKFRRAAGLRPLPVPESGGTLDELRAFLNVGSEADWRLLVAWLTAAMRPVGPYPLLVLHGQAGSAKSTTARILRRLIDPSVTALRSSPKEVRDLMIAANNSHVLSFDNLSGLPTWLSDALCRLATGGGFATRALYTDDEEVYFESSRPVLVNGIGDVVVKGDLLDRALVLRLPTIPEEKRREEASFWAAFEAAWPRLLGALLDAVSGGLRGLPDVRLDRLPRMADFARWGEAVGRAQGWGAGAFLAAFDANRLKASDVTVEDSPLALAVRDLMAARPAWSGIAKLLLTELEQRVDERVIKSRKWPKGPRALRARLEEVAPALREQGILVHFGERDTSLKRNRVIAISRDPARWGKRPSRPSRPSECTPEIDGSPGDGKGSDDGADADGLPDGRASQPSDGRRPSSQPSAAASGPKSHDGNGFGSDDSGDMDGLDGLDGRAPCHDGRDEWEVFDV